MIIKLESFLTYFAINGVPQQKGSIRIVEQGDNIGMAILGTNRQIAAPVHFSDWIDATDTPYATKQALLDAIVLAIMESNAAMPTLVGNLAPLWVGIGAFLFFKERQNSKFWIGLAIAFVGVTFLIIQDLFDPTLYQHMASHQMHL